MQGAVFFILDKSAAILDPWIWRDLTTFIVMAFYGVLIDVLFQQTTNVFRLPLLDRRSNAVYAIMTVLMLAYFGLVMWIMFELFHWTWNRLPSLEIFDPWRFACFTAVIIGLPAALIWASLKKRGTLRLAWLVSVLSVGIFAVFAVLNPHGNSSTMTTIVGANLVAIAASLIWLRYERRRERRTLRFPEAQRHPLTAPLPSQSETRHPSQDGWREL